MRKAQQASRHPRAACCALLVWRPRPQGDAAGPLPLAMPFGGSARPVLQGQTCRPARRTAVGLPVVVCCCHLRHCGPKQLAAFCPGPLSALFPKWRPAGALARGIAARCGPRAMPGKGWRRFLGHVAKALRPSGRVGWPWLRQPASPVLPPCCPHAAGSLVSARPARLRQCGSRFARQHNRAGGLGVGKGCLRVASGGKGRLGQKLTWNI